MTTKTSLTPLRLAVPATRDPFVNTPLLSLGVGPDGAERFWISTWNSCVGCLGVVVSEHGEARVYRTDDAGLPGFYSAVQDHQDPDILWLCGSLAWVARLRLSSGRFERFETGVRGALVFQGMVLDPATGKLFVCAFPPPTVVAFSFDTRKLETSQVFDPVPGYDHYMRQHFANGDGTWTILLSCPGESFVVWDPRTETIKVSQQTPQGGTTGIAYGHIEDDAGRVYLKQRGWYSPRTRRCRKGPTPAREMTWFARRGTRAYGALTDENHVTIAVWDLSTGEVRDLCQIQDSDALSCNLTATGDIVAVTRYGDFFRHDGSNGALQQSRRLPTDAIGRADCLLRLDERRLLGTPFISQRFYEIDLQTGRGVDCGRAAPGSGEVLRTWRIRNRIYMAAYTGGDLTEYDPRRPANFPENPRVVAKPPDGMRPIASADDGRCLWYACSRPYGSLGGVMVRYDTRTGRASYGEVPVPAQAVSSLIFDRRTRLLLAGTSIHADCQSCPPTADRAAFLTLDPTTLQRQAMVAAPAGSERTWLLGAYDKRHWICVCQAVGPQGARWFPMRSDQLVMPPVNEMHDFPADLRNPQPTGYAGLLLGTRADDTFVIWDLAADCEHARLGRYRNVYQTFVDDDSVYLVTARKILVFADCLAKLCGGDK